MRLAQASITRGLSLLFALVSLAVLSGVGAYLYASLEELFAQRDAAELIGKTTLVRQILAEVPSRGALMQARGPLQQVVVGHPALHLSVFDADGTLLFASPAPGLSLADLPSPVSAHAAPAPTQVVTTGPLRVLGAGIGVGDGHRERVLGLRRRDRA